MSQARFHPVATGGRCNGPSGRRARRPLYAALGARLHERLSQALLRLMMLQRQIDERAGLNTGGFISGYRGSPLGAIDQNAWKAKKHLEKSHIKFVRASTRNWVPPPCGARSSSIFT